MVGWIRITKTYHGISAAPTEIIRNNYDEIGRLSKKTILPNGTFTKGGVLDYITRTTVPTANDIAKKAICLLPGTSYTAVNGIPYSATINPNASGGTSINGLQKIDFSYHIRGGLRGINLDANGNTLPNVSEGDLFSYKLDYETAPTPQWNGNIGRQTWNRNAVNRSYNYTYDASNRLSTANYTSINSENYSLPTINYDKNGNIKRLVRNGKVGNSFGNIDDLTYSYVGNKLVDVGDAVNGNTDMGDFRPANSTTDYTYWPNGSLKSDANKGINLIEYNTFLNKVSKVNWSDGRWLKFYYDGGGTLLKRENSTGEYWEYVDGVLFKNGILYSVNVPEGRAVWENNQWNYEFEYRDVWGNLRLSFGPQNGQLTTKQVSDFDAFGYEFNKTSIPKSNFYKYQKQERVEDFGLNIDFFKFRPSDATIGRFWQVDPLADHPNQVGISPYAFLNNNPVNNIDPDGRLPIPLITGAIGAAGGLIYGLVKGKSWKETAALTAGGFVAGATLGFGTAGIAALGGIEAIGGAGATMITLGSGVVGGMLGNAAEQGVKVSLGESSSFSGNEVVLNGAFGMSEVVLGPAGKAVEGVAKNAVQDGLSQMFKPSSRAEIKSTQRELASKIRASALPGSISKSESKSAAKQLVTAAQQQRANTLQGSIRISNGVVDVSVSAMQTTTSEETKNKLNNQ